MDPSGHNPLILCILDFLNAVQKLSRVFGGKKFVCIQKRDPLTSGLVNGKIFCGRKIVDPWKMIHFRPHFLSYFHGTVRGTGVYYDLLRYDTFSPGESLLYVLFLIFYDHALGYPDVSLSLFTHMFSVSFCILSQLRPRA